MEIDYDAMDWATRQQAEMFAVMVGQMPTEAVGFLIELLSAEYEARTDK